MAAVRCYLILSVFKLIRDVPDLPFGNSAMSQSINLPDCEEEPTASYVIHCRHILHRVWVHLVHQKIQKSKMVAFSSFCHLRCWKIPLNQSRNQSKKNTCKFSSHLHQQVLTLGLLWISYIMAKTLKYLFRSIGIHPREIFWVSQSNKQPHTSH